MSKVNTHYTYPEERLQLLRLMKRDQAVRTSPTIQDIDAMLKMNRVDTTNQTVLKDILQKIPFPGITDIGHDGTQAIWLIAQHANNDLPLMKYVLNNMRSIAKHNPEDTYYQGIPYLVDRINLMEGRYQEFGTQLWTDPQTGKTIPFPIKGRDQLDTRRKKYGLNNFVDYLREFTSGI